MQKVNRSEALQNLWFVKIMSFKTCVNWGFFSSGRKGQWFSKSLLIFHQLFPQCWKLEIFSCHDSAVRLSAPSLCCSGSKVCLKMCNIPVWAGTQNAAGVRCVSVCPRELSPGNPWWDNRRAQIPGVQPPLCRALLGSVLA